MTTSEEPSESYLKGVALVAAAGVCWSIAGLVIRLTRDVSEWQILFFRSVFLVLTLLTYVAVTNRDGIAPLFRRAGRPALTAGLFLSAAFACWIFAVTHTTVANALFVLASSSFIAAVLGRVVLKERVQGWTWGCMVLAALGIAIMVLESVGIGTLAGNLFALGAATGFALFAVALRKGRNTDMTPAVCWAGMWAMIIGAVMMLTGGESFQISARDAALCASLGVVQVGLGLILFTAGSRYIPTAELVLLSLTEVVLGPVWVWLFVAETPTLYTLLGGAVVLAAIVAQAVHGTRTASPVAG